MKTNILLSDKYIFFRVPKTATTSVSIFLRNSSKILVDDYDYTYNKNDWPNIFKFSFVRNPWDRLLSCFLDKTKKCINTEYEMEFYLPFKDHTFKEFVKTLTPKFIEYDGHIRPQHKFFDISELDFVGRFENIDKDIKYVQKILELPQTQLSRENETEHNFYRNYYDNETKKIVEKLYKKDLELFSYEY